MPALRRAREQLADLRLEDGGRPEVISLPSPEPLYFRGRRLPASYANFYIANAVVLVPTFNDPADRQALGVLAELFPESPDRGHPRRRFGVGLRRDPLFDTAADRQPGEPLAKAPRRKGTKEESANEEDAID